MTPTFFLARLTNHLGPRTFVEQAPAAGGGFRDLEGGRTGEARNLREHHDPPIGTVVMIFELRPGQFTFQW